MTKARKRWPGDLDKPIRELPVFSVAHGGTITSENSEEYNKQAAATIDAAIYSERLRKLRLLAQHYNVGEQNYAGIIKALIADCLPQIKDEFDNLRKSYPIDNKTLAVNLAAELVRGFQYEPTILAPEELHWFSDVETRKEGFFIAGLMKTRLAEGRPEKWTPEQYQALFESVSKIKGSGLTDLEALRRLRRKSPWNEYTVPTLENRLGEAKSGKNPKAGISHKPKKILGSRKNNTPKPSH